MTARGELGKSCTSDRRRRPERPDACQRQWRPRILAGQQRFSGGRGLRGRIHYIDIVEDYPSIGGVAELSARLRGALTVRLRDQLVPARLADPHDATMDYLARERACIERIAAAAGPHDTILSPNFQSPVPPRSGRAKIVAVIHDVQFLHETRYFSAPHFAALVGQFQLTRDHADALVFISATSRRDFTGFFGAGPHDQVVPPVIAGAAQSAREIVRENFLLAVAHQDHHPHKNFDGLLALFAALAARDPTLRLVITGHGRASVEARVRELAPDLRGRVQHAGYVPRAALEDWFDRARAHVSLSHSEGFNMAAAEAAMRGTPLILSDLPVHRELFGDRALLVDPDAPSLDAVTAFLARPPSAAPWPHAGRSAPEAVVDAFVAMIERLHRAPSRAAPSPRTILFAQELGGGLGHVTKLIAIARHFQDARRVFLLREPRIATPLVRAALGEAPVCLPAPEPPQRATTPVAEHDMADILANVGFADPAALALAVGRWRVLADGCRPDLVVSDFAPSLRIAIAGLVPHVAVGNGFTIVPDVTPLPPFSRDETPATMHDSEARVLAAANAVRARLDLPPLPRAASLLRGDRTFCAALTCLDPYAADRVEAPIAPLGSERITAGPPLAQRRGPALFCYLDGADAALDPLLTALNALGRQAQVYIRSADPAALARHCAPHIGIHTRPAPFAQVLPQTRLLIHAGTAGTAIAGLYAGTPQLVIPTTIERQLTARALLALGVAARLDLAPWADPLRVRAALERVLADESLGRRAAAVAGELATQTRHVVPEQPIVETCRALLSNRGARAADSQQ